MDRFRYGYKYLFANDDLQQIFDVIEKAAESIAIDAQINGILETVSLPENQRELALIENSPSPDMTLDLLPGTSRALNGKSINVESTNDIDISQDVDENPTNVTTIDFEAWNTIFIAYDVDLSDQQIDARGDRFWHIVEDSFVIKVLKGAEFDPAALTLEQKKVYRQDKPFTEPNWIYLGDILKYYGMTQIAEADIYRDRKESITSGNAANIGFNNTGAFYAPSVDNVDEALEEAGERLETVEAFDTNLSELYGRYYSFGSENISLYFDKDNDKLYSANKEILNPIDSSINTDGTYHFYAIQSEIDPDYHKIICRIYKKTTDTYSNELIVDEGIVHSPKTIIVGTDYIVFYLHQTSSTAEIEIRSRKLSLDDSGGVLTLTLTNSIDNINAFGTYPVQDVIATLNDNPHYSGYKKAYDIAYDTANDKIGIIWAQSSSLAFRAIVNTTDTLGTLTTISTSVVPDDGVSIDYNGSLFLFGAYSDASTTFLTNTIDDALALGTERTLSTSNFVMANLVFCNNNTGTDYCLITGFNTSTNQVDVLRVISDNSAAAIVLVSFDAGSNVLGTLGGVWNDTIDNISIVFDDQSTGNLHYREISTGAVSGPDTLITTSGNYEIFSNSFWKSGATEHYQFIGFEKSLTFPFNIKQTRLFLIDDQAGPINNTDLQQGVGGYITIHIKNNPERFIRIHFVSKDGDSVTLENNDCFYADIDVSEYVTTGLNIRIITATNSTLTAITTAYNRPIILYRKDNLNDGLVVGVSSMKIAKNIHWFEGLSELASDQVETRHIKDNVVTPAKITDINQPNGIPQLDANGKISNTNLPFHGMLENVVHGGGYYDLADESKFYLLKNHFGNGSSGFVFNTQKELVFITNIAKWTFDFETTTIDLLTDTGGILDNMPITGYTQSEINMAVYALFDSSTNEFKGMGVYRGPESIVALTGTGQGGDTSETITLNSHARSNKYQWKIGDIAIIQENAESESSFDQNNIWHTVQITAISGGTHSSDQTITVDILSEAGSGNTFGGTNFTNTTGKILLAHRPGGVIPGTYTDLGKTNITDNYVFLFGFPFSFINSAGSNKIIGSGYTTDLSKDNNFIFNHGQWNFIRTTFAVNRHELLFPIYSGFFAKKTLFNAQSSVWYTINNNNGIVSLHKQMRGDSSSEIYWVYPIQADSTGSAEWKSSAIEVVDNGSLEGVKVDYPPLDYTSFTEFYSIFFNNLNPLTTTNYNFTIKEIHY